MNEEDLNAAERIRNIVDGWSEEYRIENIKKKRCPPSGDPDGIPKKNAWIIWTNDEENKILDLQVYELDKENMYKLEKTVKYVQYRMEEIHFSDCVCLTHDEDELSLVDLLFKFGWKYGFKDLDVMKRCLERLGRIKEFEKEIEYYMDLI